ncbi:NAD-dependent epimerase/dehydratase family protein [Dyadobacter subterraneus]|uniref:SDR family oxidoreductase n=1 Tax=Dyadobacter subterraneus TaxID=2773304 RepID=A0ABR9WC69_9BACT|nr:NAD-dependent epimerase/dehydratase family protein [Dyadobacter subterraneus]MBE9462759.1 SDR family oxidoreductase [Dyadobacter subterraneus]
MKIILTGATGFLGQEVLKQLLADPTVTEVVLLVRRSTGVINLKLKELILKDFLDYSAITKDIEANACIWCLGVPQSAVTAEEYIRITFEYALYAAKQMLELNSQLRFCFVSGASASQEEKGISLQGRIKGRPERELAFLSNNIFLFRPAFIKPSDSNYKRPLVQTIVRYVTNVLDLFSEAFSIDVAVLANCLIGVAKNGSPNKLMNNLAIKHYQEDFD